MKTKENKLFINFKKHIMEDQISENIPIQIYSYIILLA